MILYHFTAAHLFEKIKVEGITLGAIPYFNSIGELKINRNYLWLTVNKDFCQGWNTMSNIPYDRAAVKISVNIPKSYENRVFEWLKIGKGLTGMFDTLNFIGDPGNWRLFKGKIPPKWFVDVEIKQSTAQLVVDKVGGAK